MSSVEKYGKGNWLGRLTEVGPQLSSKMKNCLPEESFINKIYSKDDKSDANSIGEDNTDTKVEDG